MWRSWLNIRAWNGFVWLLWAIPTVFLWTHSRAQEGTRIGAASPGSTNRIDLLGERTRALVQDNAQALSFGLGGIPALQSTLIGVPLWQYFASGIYLMLAFLAAKAVDWVVRNRLKVFATRTAAQWDDLFVNLLDGPVKIIVFVILLNIGLHLFVWPYWIELYISRLTRLAVGISVVMVLLRMVNGLVEIWRRKLPSGGDRAFNEQFLLLVGKLIKAGLCVVAFLTILSNLGINISALLGSVSVLGLALGLAAQDTVSNLFGAVAVFVDRPFQIGDRIQVGTVDGTVESMGLRATQVRSVDGYLITVPNKVVGNNTVINISRRRRIKTELNFVLPGESSRQEIEKALKILDEVYGKHPRTAECQATFNRFVDSGVNIQVVHWWDGNDGKMQADDLEGMNLKLTELWAAAGLSLAYPTRTVRMVNLAGNG